MRMTSDQFTQVQFRLPEVTVVMSIEQVETRLGAERIYRAECAGRNRPNVIQRAMRRLDDFTLPDPRAIAL